jgi:glycosyltransferase involved in cell wall biosynthesis
MIDRSAEGPTAELSVVLPAYNEADNLAAVIEEAGLHLREAGIDHEIVVVDDGSTDATQSILAALAGEVPTLRRVIHPTNLGYGAALRSGVGASVGRFVLLSDGDGQFRMEDLSSLWRYRDRADVVLGYRNPRHDPLARRIAGWLYNRIFVRVMLGGRFRDVNCGFKLFSREVLADMELHSTGALISAELLTRARLGGASFVEVAVRHFPRTAGNATGLLPRVVLKMLGESVRLRQRILATRATEKLTDTGLPTEVDAVESASA